MQFHKFINSILEKTAPPPELPDADSGVDKDAEDAVMNDDTFEGGPEDDMNLEEEKVAPEEIELAKLAVRALYFDINSKNVHNLGMNVVLNNKETGETQKRRIPFEKIADYFEKTKNYKAVLGFVEHVMDHYEGGSSKWTENPEIKGKGILQKIRHFNTLPEDERLDNGKRVHWARIILNCLVKGQPGYNLTIDDVNEENIKEVYRKLNQDFGGMTRGIIPPSMSLRGPGT